MKYRYLETRSGLVNKSFIIARAGYFVYQCGKMLNMISQNLIRHQIFSMIFWNSAEWMFNMIFLDHTKHFDVYYDSIESN
jgi:hypothetical protein